MSVLTFQITEKDVEQYAVISGDNNPIHLNFDAAKQHGFTDKVAHGMLTISKVLGVLSNEVLSPCDAITDYNFSFSAPVFTGNQITLHINQTQNSINVSGECEDKKVIKGSVFLL
ncbi:MaoC/PaaZ C-terminal domain-containing protein [Fictibacillus enclensis]|uniref:MaoC/PaaZ C-terminal domain-containing protein n=1 Tax=Fictibacillus enclensis TaxID=1017270 RepID=UPI0025A0E6B1|nr:MaoC/PaaZ C-terminal domain-containing protein [Fictibacillus enclensis]MDM5199429.1 MaoC/PaaZ C-terminal domain-containing protein [Fictibacillus enclensis]